MVIENKRRIKILRIIARLNIGGPAKHAILLTDGLDNKNFDSLLVAGKVAKGEEELQYFAGERNVKPYIIPQLQREINPYKELVAFFRIFLLFAKERPDIVHTHTAKAGALGRIAAVFYNNTFGRKNRCKIIHTFHGTVFSGYFGRITTGFFIRIERILAKFSDRIIVVSEKIKEELLQLRIGCAEKITVVPLGLELQDLLNVKPRSNNSGFDIGIVGRLVPIKNHRMFLEAVKLFLDGNPPSQKCNFFIIGDGELRHNLQAYAQALSITEAVKFCGWNSSGRAIYDSLDIVVLTSLNEGTPVSLIEAMAAARPVISTDVGAVGDLMIKSGNHALPDTHKFEIYDNGILCRSGDALGLKEALDFLFKNDNIRANMGSAARAFVRFRFSKERLIKDMEVLYNICLKENNQ